MTTYTPDAPQLVLAMDHARLMGVVPGLEDPGETIEMAIEAGVDAIMTSYGVIKRYRDQLIGRVPTLLRVDGGPSVYREDWLANTQWRLLHTIDDAQALGVDGLCSMVFLGSEVEMDTLAITAEIARHALDASLPLMVEALPCPGARIPDPNDAQAMADACRLAFEHGADVVKTYATGDAESFARVTGGCPVPVVVAGGPKMDTETAMLQVVKETLDAGGRGVVFGRNVWQAPNPAAVIGALRNLIHDGGTVESASALLA
ncbi:class I fructose-bisphosphate aldolase [Ilumatobacter coccineus]|jgi:DhnA family fructose-bisphosphate aldolase class Ia|uniref:Putative fructose-bisphosphate aldolase class I n=1 Tax=Ilumatobacter coccineus (strain NBRC 103263 / KCTC 29153 / YM16-304) TaxID=1313172 RepID=A0A6C7EIG7_ILUCY|nr:fructose-bisphosphate aldolase [Ilumatobacter coccineus]BAN04328.1 putative fructose-bisphosphate aldolase class I [Ilumatobacter coccineus YM16-304]